MGLRKISVEHRDHRYTTNIPMTTTLKKKDFRRTSRLESFSDCLGRAKCNGTEFYLAILFLTI